MNLRITMLALALGFSLAACTNGTVNGSPTPVQDEKARAAGGDSPANANEKVANAGMIAAVESPKVQGAAETAKPAPAEVKGADACEANAATLVRPSWMALDRWPSGKIVQNSEAKLGVGGKTWALLIELDSKQHSVAGCVEAAKKALAADFSEIKTESAPDGRVTLTAEDNNYLMRTLCGTNDAKKTMLFVGANSK
jgi:hypothetical protein